MFVGGGGNMALSWLRVLAFQFGGALRVLDVYGYVVCADGPGGRIVEVANGYARLWLHQTEVFDALQAHAWILILTFLVCLANSPNRIFDGFLADHCVPMRKSMEIGA